MNENEKVRCAIIGIGSMGKKYALMLDQGKIEGLRLVAVCCHSEKNECWVQNHLSSSVRIFHGEDEMYESADVFDAVLIVTPHKLHPSMTIRAFREGKHVLCDKPAGTVVWEARKMNQSAEQAQKVYAMMCHQRTYPKYLKIKEWLDEKTIGTILRISMENSSFFRTKYYHQSASWRSSWKNEGGGLLINQGYHLLDMWIYLFGLPQSVYAEIPFGKYNSFDVDDEVTLIMNYPHHVTGTFIASTGEGKASERLEIVGTRGCISAEGNRLTLTTWDTDILTYAQEAQVTSRQQLNMREEHFHSEEAERPYEQMLCNFGEAILYQKPLIAPGKDGVETLSLINAAYLSAWTGKKVSLPFSEEEYQKILRQKEEAEEHRTA